MAYLNYNSTDAKHNHTLNYSDIAYEQVMDTRVNVNNFILNVKKFVNAPLNAEVIINSGATESIANCVLWAKISNPYGSIYGTQFDHEAVKINCDNFKVPYHELKSSIPRDASMIFLTHVSGKTGEVLDINNFMRNFNSKTYANQKDQSVEQEELSVLSETGQFKPLVVVDATQSINKIKIDMEQLGVDALFFSLHKIGGPQGYGVLVIKPNNVQKFVPLVGGNQQKGLRGGTLDMSQLSMCSNLLKINSLNTKEKWEESVNYLMKNGINVVKPSHKHLYNTILIHLNTCPVSVINYLAKKYSIYVGAISACTLEKPNASESKDGFIRLSFSDPSELSTQVLKNIVNSIHKLENLDIPQSQINSRLTLHGGFFREQDQDFQQAGNLETKVNYIDDLTQGIKNNSSNDSNNNSSNSSRSSSDNEDNDQNQKGSISSSSNSSDDEQDRRTKIKNLNELNAIIDKTKEFSSDNEELYKEFEVEFT